MVAISSNLINLVKSSFKGLLIEHEDDDLTLFNKAKYGDENAFKKLVARYSELVNTNATYCHTRNPWISIDEFKVDAIELAWNIVRNSKLKFNNFYPIFRQSLKHLVCRLVTRSHYIPTFSTIVKPGTDDSFLEETIPAPSYADDDISISEIKGVLNDTERQIIELDCGIDLGSNKDLEEFNQAEIAERFGLQIVSLKRRLRLARFKLKVAAEVVYEKGELKSDEIEQIKKMKLKAYGNSFDPEDTKLNGKAFKFIDELTKTGKLGSICSNETEFNILGQIAAGFKLIEIADANSISLYDAYLIQANMLNKLYLLWKEQQASLINP